MLKWGIIFVLIATAFGLFGLQGTTGAMATIMGGMFFIFFAIAIFLFFAEAMKPNRPVRR